jgi:hypothetical protein
MPKPNPVVPNDIIDSLREDAKKVTDTHPYPNTYDGRIVTAAKAKGIEIYSSWTKGSEGSLIGCYRYI